MRRIVVWFAAAALLAPRPAAAQFSLPADWAERPGQDQLARYYPKLALALELEGYAIVRCKVPATGVPRDCTVEQETPKGLGFGEAATRMAAGFRMRPPVGARSKDDTVRIPVRFTLPPPKESPAAAPSLPPAKAALAGRLAAASDQIGQTRARYDRTIRELEAVAPPGVAKETSTAAAQALRTGLDTHIADMAAGISAALAAPLDEGQLEAAVRFAEGPAGRRYLKPDPELGRRQHAVTRAAFTTFRRELQAAFCARRACEGDLTAFMMRTLRGQERPTPDAPVAAAMDRQPTQARLADAWPLGRLMAITAFVELECLSGPTGALEDCAVAFESPRDLGAGQAALGLAEQYRLKAEWIEQGLTGRKVRVPIMLPGAIGEAAPPRPATASPRALALAREVVATYEHPFSDPAKVFELIEKDLEALEPAFRDEARAAWKPAFERARQTFLDEASALLVQTYDEAGLQAIRDFRTGVGAAMMRDQRTRQAELTAVAEGFNQKILADARAMFCKTNDCTPPPEVKAADR